MATGTADLRASDLRKGACALLGAIRDMGCSVEDALSAMEASSARRVSVKGRPT